MPVKNKKGPRRSMWITATRLGPNFRHRGSSSHDDEMFDSNKEDVHSPLLMKLRMDSTT